MTEPVRRKAGTRRAGSVDESRIELEQVQLRLDQLQHDYLDLSRRLDEVRAELEIANAKLEHTSTAERKLRSLVRRHWRGTWTLIVGGKIPALFGVYTLQPGGPLWWVSLTSSVLLFASTVYLLVPYVQHAWGEIGTPTVRRILRFFRRFTHRLGEIFDPVPQADVDEAVRDGDGPRTDPLGDSGTSSAPGNQ